MCWGRGRGAKRERGPYSKIVAFEGGGGGGYRAFMVFKVIMGCMQMDGLLTNGQRPTYGRCLMHMGTSPGFWGHLHPPDL